VPLMEIANELASKADLLTVIGTSLNVYPAAGLVNYTPSAISKWLIDPSDFNLEDFKNMTHIKETAVNGMRELKERLRKLK